MRAPDATVATGTAVAGALRPAAARLEQAVRNGEIPQPGVADPARVLLRQASRYHAENDHVATARSLAALVRYVEGRSGQSVAAPAAQAIVAAVTASGLVGGGK